MSTQNILLFLGEFFSDVMLIAKLLKECLYIFFLINCLFFKKRNYLPQVEEGRKAKLPAFVKRLIFLSDTLIHFQAYHQRGISNDPLLYFDQLLICSSLEARI